MILIHSINNTTRFQKFFSIESGIGQFAVPLFFMVSGFLFFQNITHIESVPKKINKRIYTVFYPYMIWNFIYYIIHHLIKPGEIFSLMDLVESVLSYTYNPAFWFMFQLILLIAITPIVYYAIEKTGHYIIFFLIISFFIVKSIDIPFINEDAIIYFSFGAFATRLYEKNKLYLIEKKYIIFSMLIAIFFFLFNRIAFALVNKDIVYVGLFTLSVVLVRLSTAVFIFYLVDLFFRYDKAPAFMGNAFFLYAIHYMIVKFLIIIMNYIKYKFLEPDVWTAVETVVFVLSPVICVVVSFYLSKFLSKRFSKAYSFMVGGRND